MQSKAPRVDFKFSFHLIDTHYNIVKYEKADANLKKTWEPYYSYIKEIIGNNAIDYSHSKLSEIKILFLESAQLSEGGQLLNKLAKKELNKFETLKKEKPLPFAPMITIGTFDIMSLYSYPFEKEMKMKWESRMLRDLRLDKRYKFLDSSIWFRYIAIKPSPLDEERNENEVIKNPVSASGETPFFERFEELLEEVCKYWVDGLYSTNAGLATLELQLRLLQHSRISDKIGEGGHAEAVTPFKFHSESFLQIQALNEIEFFTKDRGGDNKDNDISIRSECRLRILIVDDQGKALSTVRGEKVIGKKDLILKPLCDVFTNLQIKEDVVFPDLDQEKESGVIEFCLKRLEKNSFDLIFLDYLLGKRKNHPSIREYGHEFLLNLLNDSRAKNSNYRRSFQGKFWIFSISSFPFALPDKLHQLGISHLQNLWHLSYGGDPVTTPHLYKYYLLRFIKQKVSSYFLHPDLLLRILKENPVHIKKSNEKFWAEYLENTILNWRQRVDLASRHAQDDNSSPFTESIAWFCKKNVPLNKTLDLILKVTSLMKEGHIGGSAFFACQMEFETPLLNQYKLVGDYFFKQISGFRREYIRDQNRQVKTAEEERSRNLNLENLKIYELVLNNDPLHELGSEVSPQDSSHQGLKLSDLSETINELILSRNHLASFPKAVFALKKLSRLYLDHNPIASIEGDINLLPRLTDLNLSNTPLGTKLNKPHAQNREEVLQLWKEAMAIQKSTSIKKVLYFGLSPENNDKLRVDREFQQIRMALKGERFELIPNFAVNYIDFQREVLKNKAEIIHFSGHGNNQSLVFQKSVGSDEKVEFKTVEDFFKNSFVRENLQCIILNACKTKEQAQVLSLHQLHAIGMSGSIEDERAIAFSAGFYNAVHLIEDQNFKDAFHMGVNAAKNEENNLKKRERDTGDFSNLLGDLTVHLYFDGKEIASEVFKKQPLIE